MTVPRTSVMRCAYTEKRWNQVLTAVDSIRGWSMGSAASFRRDVFDLVGGFRSGLGRSAGRLPLGCEETVLRGDPSGPGHAGAIVIDLTAAGVGYPAGSMRKWVRRDTRGMRGAFPQSEGHRDIGSE